MGADSFVVFFGIRHVVQSDVEIDRLERGTDERLIAARQAKLKTYFGRSTDGETYFLLIGYHVGTFGVENSIHTTLSPQQINEIVGATKKKLEVAEFNKDEPMFHFQFEAQY